MAIIFEKKEKEMACNVTANSGQSKGLEDALGATVKGKLQGKDWKKRKLIQIGKMLQSWLLW